MINKFFGVLLITSISTVASAGLVAPGYILDVHGGLSVMSTSLQGNGFAGDLSNASGSNYGAELGYSWVNRSSVRLRYSHSEAEFDPPSSITPDKITAARNEYMMYGMFSPFQNSGPQGLSFGIGYSYMTYEVGNNSPVIVTEQQAQGLSFIAQNEVELNDKLLLTAKALLFLPHLFTEGHASTGFGVNYLGVEGGLQVGWRVREDIGLYLAGVYRLDTVKFVGTGNRGTSQGTDSRTTIMIPIGVIFSF